MQKRNINLYINKDEKYQQRLPLNDLVSKLDAANCGEKCGFMYCLNVFLCAYFSCFYQVTHPFHFKCVVFIFFICCAIFSFICDYLFHHFLIIPKGEKYIILESILQYFFLNLFSKSPLWKMLCYHKKREKCDYLCLT